MRLQGETRELLCELTEADLAQRGADLCEAVREADEYEAYLERRRAEWRDAHKTMKEELAHLRKTASDVAAVVHSGEETRDIPCNWLYALAVGYAFLVRSDNQELVTHRKLRDEERQMELGEPPFAEPTPEQLEEWLRTLPVNEEQALPEGHAGEVTAEDHDPLLDPGGFADEDQDEDGNTLGGDDDWKDEDDDDPALDTEEDMLEQAIDDAIVTDEHGELLEEPISAGSTTPPFNPNPGISELAAMPDEQVAQLARRK